MPVYKKVNTDFFKKWSPDMAYILGFFAADGCITVNKRGGQFWSIQIGDKKLLESIKKVVGSDHKITIIKAKNNRKNSFRLQIGSIGMCTDLRNLGMTEKKTKSLTVPYVPNKYMRHFIRGYFDGDGNVWMGYINKNRKIPFLTLLIAFTSCSYVFLSNLQERLVCAGTRGGSLFRLEKGYSRLQYSTEDALKLSDFMYNDVGASPLFLQRKRDVFHRYKIARLRL